LSKGTRVPVDDPMAGREPPPEAPARYRPAHMSNGGGMRVLTGIQLDWLYLFAILAFAALARIIFFSGALGTDEIVYLTQAYHLLQGDYLHTSYIGGMRDGINAFLAASISLFGRGIVGAGGLFFACSLGQVALAYGFAHHLWGRQAAIWAGLTMAALPIEVVQAGSLNPDPYLGLVIASSVVTFYFAERDDRPGLYMVAGLLAGWVFWIKQVVVIYGMVFVFFAVAGRRWRLGWLWFTFGSALLFVAQLGIFWIAYGDPFYFFKVNYQFITATHISVSETDTSLSRYLILLFVKVYHTGLLGWLALAACVFAFRRTDEPGLRFVLIWGLGLVLIFSAFPISFSPPKFIAKQSNYMDIFMMPLALLTGWFLAHQRRRVALLLGGAMVVSGILLSALEQQVVRVVTVNGRSAAAFAQGHAGIPVFGPLTAQRQSALLRLLGGSLDSSGDIRPWAELSRVSLIGGSPSDVVAYLIEDPQMQNWPEATPEKPLPGSLRRCLLPTGALDREDLGLGRSVLATLRSLFAALPTSVGAAALAATDPIWQVAPAQVYAITRECAHDAQGLPAP
jgi:4-amino-4-deoxy-L-arabinose transferase-like glycosyltransferase